MEKRVRVIGQVYPWDLADDPGRAQTFVDAGIDTVAIAANYHAVRAVNWIGGSHPRVIHQQRSAYYVPMDSGSWDAANLIPPAPAPRFANTFSGALEAAANAGLKTRAWIVLTHDDSGLIRAHPELATVDPWINRSEYALCPSKLAVAAYCRALIVHTVRETGIRSYFLESLSAPGFAHSLSHDKAAFVGLSRRDIELMSICCCDDCDAAAAADGWSLPDLAREARDSLALPMLSARLASLLESHHRTRARIASELAALVSSDVDGLPLDVTVCATSDLRSASAFAPLIGLPRHVRAMCADLSAPHSQGWADLDAWSPDNVGVRAAVLQLTGPKPSLDTTLMASGATAEKMRSIDELYLYHVGLRRPDTLKSLSIRTSALLFPGET